MNRYFKIFTILIIASLFGLYHCAGGIDLDLTTAEEEVVSPVLRLEDPAGVTLLNSGTEGVDPTSLNIAFREPVDICEGCLALTCDELPYGVDQPTITVEQTDEEGKEYTITTADAYKYQLKVCTLTISEEVLGASTSSNAALPASKAAILREEVSFTFRCGCAVNEDFNADSHSCYTVQSQQLMGYHNETTWWSWEWILDEEVITFNKDAGVMIYDDTLYEDNAYYDVTNNDRSLAFGKTVEISEEGFDVTIHFRSASGFSALDDAQDFAMVGIYGSPLYLSYIVGTMSINQKQYCVASWYNLIDPEDPAIYAAGIECGTGEHYIRLTYTGDSVTPEYSADGESWSTLEQVFPDPAVTPMDMPIIENLSGIGRLQFNFGAPEVQDPVVDPRNNRAIIESLIATGLSGTGGQY